MGLAALARGERRMMPLGMLPYLLWPTRTALQARCRDRLARDLRRHLLCTVGVLYGCGTTRATRGAPSAAAGRRRSSPTPARPPARALPPGRPAASWQYHYQYILYTTAPQHQHSTANQPLLARVLTAPGRYMSDNRTDQTRLSSPGSTTGAAGFLVQPPAPPAANTA